MADTNHTRRDDYLEFSEDDPFAELTRIMGHDPREAQPAAPVQEQATVAPALVEGEVDFALELERELAGDLDFSDFDVPAPQADWSVEQDVAAQVDTFQPVPVEPSAPEQFELDSDFDAFFAEEAAAQEPAVASYDAYHPETPAGGMDQGYESLGDALERELLADEAAWAEPEPEPALVEPAYEVAAYSQEPLSAAIDEQPQATEDDWAVEAEFDVDFLERELAASTATDQWQSQPQHEAMTPPPASFEAEPFGEMAVVEAVEPAVEDLVGEEPDERPLSLEEELQLLLADEPLPVAPRVVAPAVSGITAASLGRANFSATPPEAAELARNTAEEDVFNPPVTPAETYQSYQPYQPSAEPAVEMFVEEIAGLPDEQPAGSPAENEFSTSAGDEAADDLGDIFGDDFALQLDDMIEEEILAEPVAASAPELPDIETVEVAETVPPVTDDLDIPEIDYGTTAAAAPDFHDDFQSDFDHLFGDVTAGEARPAVVAASMAAPVAGAQMQGAQIQGQDNYFHQDMQWQAEQPAPDQNYASDTGYHYETDLEQAIAMSTYEDEPAPPSSRRRGLFVAAAVGGVVALGGLGVFGMSMLGGGSDSPVIVRADPDPMKVRPENPGGTTVPNQDNQVYQQVSGTGSDAGPRQEQLITSAEEPVDVVARTVTPQEPTSALAPGVEDEAAQAAPATETRPVKSEERIEQTSPATSPVEAQETAIVTPRRVRTMVVRPDGTMVPREEPAAVVPTPGTVEPAVAGQALTDGEASALVPMAQPVQPVDEIDDGPTLEMPQTVSVLPTQRSQAVQAQQPVATAQPAAPQPAAPQPAAPAQQIAAAPVAAPATAAAAGSEWSMQIASQPTAEGAQASYQDLARRYGSVLEGRGVNIVRADIDGRGTYYRVRIPASSRDEAIQLCTRYKAVGGSCFVSR